MRAAAPRRGERRADAYASRHRSSSSAPGWSSLHVAPRSEIRPTGLGPPLQPLRRFRSRSIPSYRRSGRDGPELEPADGPFLPAHRLGRLPRGEAGEEPQLDGLALLRRSAVAAPRRRCPSPGGATASSSGPVLARSARSTTTSSVGVLAAGPDVIDDDVPGQPEEPAPEGDAPRLVARQRLQGLDEDELRQVLRVARAADAGWRRSGRPARGSGRRATRRPQGHPALRRSTRRSIASSSMVITIRAPPVLGLRRLRRSPIGTGPRPRRRRAGTRAPRTRRSATGRYAVARP